MNYKTILITTHQIGNKLAKALKIKFLHFPLWLWLTFLFLSILKICLTSGQQLWIIGGAAHDDRLFINLAKDLLAGDWLGNYNNLTLAKGPFYPIWIAINFIVGLPLLLSQHLLYIIAILILIFALRPIITAYIYLFIIFIVLLFNPMSYYVTRVVREDLYTSLTLLVISSFVFLFTRINKAIWEVFAWSLFSSLSFSFFWLTREEGVWILPFIIPLLAYMIYRLFKEKTKQWKIKIFLCILPIIILFCSLVSISAINYYKYGLFTVVEFKNSEFLQAYGSLTRVKDSEWEQYLPVSKEKRYRIYKHSRAFAELKPFLEDDIGVTWAQISSGNLEGKNSNEIWGGWFMWAFRDAVSKAGYYTDGKSSLNYYKKLATEINEACEKKELDCLPARKTMVPPWNKNYPTVISSSIFKSIVYAITFTGTTATPNMSVGSKDSIDLFSQITHEPAYPLHIIFDDDKKTKKINGWAFGTSDKIAFSIKNGENKAANFSIKIGQSPDVYDNFLKQNKDFENSRVARFEIETDCIDNCFLLITKINEAGLSKIIPLNGSIKASDDNNIFLYIDSIKDGERKGNKVRPVEEINKIKIDMLNKIGTSYQFVMPSFFTISFIIFLILFLKQKFKNNLLYKINILLFLILMSRIILLSIIDATSFPSINIGYLNPAYPLILLFSTINYILVIDIILRRKRLFRS